MERWLGARSRSESKNGTMSMKDQVNQMYLEGMTKLSNRPFPENRRLLVIGSNIDNKDEERDNIGATFAKLWIARSLGEGADRSIVSVDNSNVDYVSDDMSGFTDLVICCGTTHLAWIEEQVFGMIDLVVRDCLVAPIEYTRRFVKDT